MKVTQISVFLENKSGRLADVTRILANNNVNIRALSIADTKDYGLLRLIVDDPSKAKDALTNADIIVKPNEVLAIEVPDSPGGLAGIIDSFADANVNIEYMYAFVGKSEKNAIVIFRVSEVDEAIIKLKERGVKILSGEELHSI
ncbi:MAG: ACT domain-containing protein [Armatimonadota bacterium]